MRTLILAALLASIAVPAPAFAPDHESRRHGLSVRNATQSETHKSSGPERSSDRPRPQRESGTAPRFDRPAPVDQARPVDRSRPLEVQRSAPLATGIARAERNRGGDVAPVPKEPGVAVQAERPQKSFEPRMVRAPRSNREPVNEPRAIEEARRQQVHDRTRSAAIEERNLRRPPAAGSKDRDLVQQRRDGPRVFQPVERRVSRTPAFGTEPPVPRSAATRAARPERAWRTDWRHDRRYDWNSWKRHHRSHFRLGLYYDPYGWDYFRYGIGWRLWPSYYRSSYWLNDPFQYRLPPAYGPYRWVRYHHDAVLVNIYTGEIADIVYDFFW